MLRNGKHEKKFDTQTLFTDISPLMEDAVGSPDVADTTETTNRKTLANSEIAISADLMTQKYEPRPLTPEDDIYEDIIEQFASAPTKPKYWFEEFGDYWSCSCGHINNGDACESCGLDRELLRSLFILHKPEDAKDNIMGVRPIQKSRSGKKAAAFNKKIIIAIIACAVLISAGGAGIYLHTSSAGQGDIPQKLQTGSIVPETLTSQAAAIFPKDMSAFTEAVNSGKFAYVKKNLPKGDPQAETYMAQLVADNYPGIQEIYDEYYAWKVDIVANTSEEDFSTDVDIVSRKDTVYFHATLGGGKPEEIIELYYEVSWPNGSSEIYGLDSLWQAGSKITARFQYPIPLFGTEGKLTFNLYEKNTNELIGTDSVTFKN